MIKIKRIYNEPDKQDGYRILIDRLWPRGLSKNNAKIDMWLKDIAPSDKLRKWFSHDVKKWREFEKRYMYELKTKINQIEEIRKLEKKHKTVVLLYSTKDQLHNNAVVLSNYLKR